MDTRYAGRFAPVKGDRLNLSIPDASRPYLVFQCPVIVGAAPPPVAGGVVPGGRIAGSRAAMIADQLIEPRPAKQA